MNGVIIVGFTGTRAGMQGPQAAMVYGTLGTLSPARVHHGGAVGADTEFHELFVRLCVAGSYRSCDVWPEGNERYVAWLERPATRYLNLYVQLPRLPLDRNVCIVQAVHHLIAAPRLMKEEQRSGTWHTIRRARELGRAITIVWPDGTTSAEEPRQRRLRL